MSPLPWETYRRPKLDSMKGWQYGGQPGLLESRLLRPRLLGQLLDLILREKMALHCGPHASGSLTGSKETLGPISSALLLPQVSLDQVKSEAIYMPG